MSGPASYETLPLPFVAHSDTSRAAAEQALDARPTALRRVYMCILFRGMRGATDEEVQDSLMMNANTERPRRVELVRRGLVRSGGERETRSGRMAVAWLPTEKRWSDGL